MLRKHIESLVSKSNPFIVLRFQEFYDTYQRFCIVQKFIELLIWNILR